MQENSRVPVTRRSKQDPNFIGYTYKNWEAVQNAPAGRGVIANICFTRPPHLIGTSPDIYLSCCGMGSIAHVWSTDDWQN